MATLELYIIRHGIAAERGEEYPDDSKRPLTNEGIARLRKEAKALDKLDVAFDLILTSPLVRARQTAAILAEETGAELRVEPLLAPGATVEELRRAVAGIDGAVATVGHQPDCSEIALAVIGRDPGFPPGGSAPLELSPD
jgi:phosphohistidine phosphatase